MGRDGTSGCVVRIKALLCSPGLQTTPKKRCRKLLNVIAALSLTTMLLLLLLQPRSIDYIRHLPSKVEELAKGMPLLGRTGPRHRPEILSEKDVYLCAVLKGRLGNAFFFYVSSLGLARANNMSLVLKDESVLRTVLARPADTDADFEVKCADALLVEQRRCCVFDERLVKLPHNDRYRVQGCLISWRYFRDYLTSLEIRSRLQFRHQVMEKATSIVARLRESAAEKNVTLVGMHIRRGDQANFLAYWNGHKPVTVHYIERAISYFKGRYPTTHFLLASDDTAWCRKHVTRNRNDVTVMDGNSAEVDMAALTLTDHMIVSVGTFGWWAGFFNPGTKTYMKDFIAPGSIFSDSFDDVNASDYIYPDWVGL